MTEREEGRVPHRDRVIFCRECGSLHPAASVCKPWGGLE